MAKQPCLSCGAEILPETAAKTGGRCRPCATGTRKNIDEGIRALAERKAGEEESFWQNWLQLCDRARQNGFSSLSPVEQAFYAMNHLKGTVFRGGFHPYFDMADAAEIRVAQEAFRENGAPAISEILGRAIALLFPAGLPVTIAEQSEQLPMWTDEEIERDIEPEWGRLLEALDQEFYATGDLSYTVVERYFAQHFDQLA